MNRNIISVESPSPVLARHARHCGAARDRRRRRPGGAPLSGILRRHDPQQEHPHGVFSCLPCGSSPGATSTRIGEIADIEPLHVAAYIEALGKDFEKPTVKQHLAAIRMLFDWLVTGQIVATNPAHSVRGPKHVVKTGKTTVLTGEQARELLDSIDVSTARRPARPGADCGDDLRLRPHRRGRRHARRGLFSQGQALVGPPA